MFGNLGQLASLLKNAGQIRENMKDMQEKMKTARFVGEAGGGQVKATVDGKAELVAIKIEPELLGGGDAELLEEFICASVSDAVRQSREEMQRQISEATGGLDIQSMMDQMGGGPG